MNSFQPTDITRVRQSFLRRRVPIRPVTEAYLGDVYMLRTNIFFIILED